MNDETIENDNLGSVTQQQSQASYKETEYSNSDWEVVGEQKDTRNFEPLEIEVIDGDFDPIDPMFADYGGIGSTEGGRRVHLPKDQAAQIQRQSTQEFQVAEVANLISKTEEEWEALKAEVFAEGKQAALEEAIMMNNEKFASAESGIKEVLQDLQNQLIENLNQVEKSSVELSMHIANKIIGQAVEVNPEYILEIIKESINLSAYAEIQSIRVSSDDFEFLQLVGAVNQLRKDGSAWEFISDENINAGCVVDTSAGEIDFQLDSAWERIKEKVVSLIK